MKQVKCKLHNILLNIYFNIHICNSIVDDYKKALNKIKQAQITSDCQSEIDDILPTKRKIQKPKRYDDNSSDDEDEPLSKKYAFPLPPKITKINEKINETSPSLSRKFDKYFF